jgi:hypothetical protein
MKAMDLTKYHLSVFCYFMHQELQITDLDNENFLFKLCNNPPLSKASQLNIILNP